MSLTDSRLRSWAAAHRASGLDAHVQLCHNPCRRFEVSATPTAPPLAAVAVRPSAEFTMLLVLGGIPVHLASEAQVHLGDIHAAAPDTVFKTGVIDGGQDPLPALALRRSHSLIAGTCQETDPIRAECHALCDGNAAEVAALVHLDYRAARVLLLKHAAALSGSMNASGSSDDGDSG